MEKVQVLLSTYNGEKYVESQIISILGQENVDVSILIRDDGSKDTTLDIIKKLAEQNDNISFYQGDNIGAARSFMDLINKSKEVDYYAFSDQDDIWDKEKLISAIDMLNDKKDEASLYISALDVVDENLNLIEHKKVNGNFCFEGQMIKNFSTGCTQVLNKKMCDVIKSYNPDYIIMHDSWITRVCYAIGGNVIIDDNSYIKYRQHSDNVLGYEDTGLQKLKRQYKIAFKNNERMRVNIAKEIKKGYYEIITKEAKEVVDNLISYPEDKKAKRWLLHNKNFRTNDRMINIKMKLAIKLNKF